MLGSTVGSTVGSSVDGPSTAAVTLSPTLSTQRLPTVVDSVTTQWARSPFGELPQGGSWVSGVLEFSLREGGTGAEVPLPPLRVTGGPVMPVHFRVGLGT